MAQKVRVGLNGYGVIGKRVADSEPVSIPHLGGAEVPHPAVAAVHAAHIACLYEGFKGAEEPVEWEA